MLSFQGSAEFTLKADPEKKVFKVAQGGVEKEFEYLDLALSFVSGIIPGDEFNVVVHCVNDALRKRN